MATVLVVDDESEVRELVSELLERHGYRVLTASDGTEAIHLARTQRSIQVLLTDLVMPEIGGKELAEQLRGLQPDVKVLLMSGFDSGFFGEDEPLPPDTRLLEKPFMPSVLLDLIEDVLKG